MTLDQFCFSDKKKAGPAKTRLELTNYQPCTI